MLTGPSTELYMTLSSEYPELDIIASGGVSSFSDIEMLNTCGAKGVIVGKAFYDGIINEKEVRGWLESE